MSEQRDLAVRNRREYERSVASYAEANADRSVIEPMLREFTSRLSPGARVIDLGCGPGGSPPHSRIADSRRPGSTSLRDNCGTRANVARHTGTSMATCVSCPSLTAASPVHGRAHRSRMFRRRRSSTRDGRSGVCWCQVAASWLQFSRATRKASCTAGASGSLAVASSTMLAARVPASVGRFLRDRSGIEGW